MVTYEFALQKYEKNRDIETKITFFSCVFLFVGIYKYKPRELIIRLYPLVSKMSSITSRNKAYNALSQLITMPILASIEYANIHITLK